MQVEKGTGPEGMKLLFGVVSSLTVEVRRSAAVLCLQGGVVLYVYSVCKANLPLGRFIAQESIGPTWRVKPKRGVNGLEGRLKL
jgi:hypothetical protein